MPSLEEHVEKANLCPVTSLTLIIQETEVAIGKTADGLNAWVLTDTTEGIIEPRFNPLALFVRARSRITNIGARESTETIVAVDEVDGLSEQSTQQNTKDRAFSEAVFMQLGANCLSCVLSTHCPSREKLAAQAQNPSLRYK